MDEKTEEQKIEEYRAAMAAVVLAAYMLSSHDIPALVRAIEHTDTMGPMLDPTLWMKKGKAMREDREMLMAAQPLHALGIKLGMYKGAVPT